MAVLKIRPSASASGNIASVVDICPLHTCGTRDRFEDFVGDRARHRRHRRYEIPIGVRMNGVPHPLRDLSGREPAICRSLFQQRKLGNNFFQQSFEPHRRRAIRDQPILRGIGFGGDQQVDRTMVKMQLIAAAKEDSIRNPSMRTSVSTATAIRCPDEFAAAGTVSSGNPPDFGRYHAFNRLNSFHVPSRAAHNSPAEE